MKIESILNPSGGEFGADDDACNVNSIGSPDTRANDTHPSRRGKPAKDAAIFVKAKFNGPVRFPPHEADGDEELRSHHKSFQIHPMGHIGEYCRNIPYQSEKKDFLARTGRDGFNVFQYTYKVRGDDKEYVVMWDYNIGLVRITPFFKSLKHSKTTPARSINVNPGLRDITHSITGGALAAQGYWMPFNAAKALAATFCYEIRYALTPVFGKDFLDVCIHPDDPAFNGYKISPTIVEACISETESWRNRSEDQYSGLSTPLTTPRLPHDYSPWNARSTRRRVIETDGSDSEYGTAESCHVFSPEISPTSQPWTSINRYPSPASSKAIPSPYMHNRFLSAIPRSWDDGMMMDESSAETNDGDVDSEAEAGLSYLAWKSPSSMNSQELAAYEAALTLSELSRADAYMESCSL
ncbi:DNA-binding domain of Mlu1-box binding protein MBP1 [Patellaria atrata CBS 101060]|uniref:DNA-binding domain of Mlu1-box binding protein MBP1 n=1 Tax=Patellaria atrata CBS 101060 TaxID=1346257 RepID=A0A9P4VQM8_9PEZI|nr:DNA-binding domain of Mlu1-box binding protein MBP1 [Patellaria atrata CBS 101060]